MSINIPSASRKSLPLMAAFSFEHYPSSLLDSALLPPYPAIKMSGLIEDGEMINASFFSFPDNALSPTLNAGSSLRTGSASAPEQLTPHDSSSFAAEDAVRHVKADRKGKNRDGSSLNSPLSKGAKGRKQKNETKEREEKLKPKAQKRSQKETSDLPPTGYIHVRARRGQATDSHSLAERLRREKISERMKLLQGLVPGCDKVVGKALVLDEIINYVQSLQNQIEFLSMKLAFHGFRVDFDEDCMAKSQRPNSSAHFQGGENALWDTYHTSFPAINNYPLTNGSDHHLLHGRSPESFSEENVNHVWQMDKRKEMLDGQAVCSSLCPFQ